MSVQPPRPVPGFPGYYASPDGRVYSDRPWRGSVDLRELAGGVNARGYRQVILCIDGVRTVREVHAIIAATFHGPRPAGLDTRHLDGDKTNNAASNLRYGTRSENELDKVRHRQMRRAALSQRRTYDPRQKRQEPRSDWTGALTWGFTCGRYWI